MKVSADVLKYFAVIAMTIDHIALVFVSPDSWIYYAMRLVGRMTAPIMSYFIAEGFRHTRNQWGYFRRIALLALISQPFYSAMIHGGIPSIEQMFSKFNVMYTFAISLLILIIIDCKIHKNVGISVVIKTVVIGVCFSFSALGDWSIFIPAWVLIFRKTPLLGLVWGKFKGNLQMIVFVVASLILITERIMVSTETSRFNQLGYLLIFAIVPIGLLIRKYRQKRNFNSVILLFFLAVLIIVTHGVVVVTTVSAMDYINFGVIFAIFPLSLYNGKRFGRDDTAPSILISKSEISTNVVCKPVKRSFFFAVNKWFFYVYYPLHIAVLVIINYNNCSM